MSSSDQDKVWSRWPVSPSWFPGLTLSSVCVTLTRYNYPVLSALSHHYIHIVLLSPLPCPPPISTHFISAAATPHKNSIKYNNIHNSQQNFYNRHQSAGLCVAGYSADISISFSNSKIFLCKRQNSPKNISAKLPFHESSRKNIFKMNNFRPVEATL